MLYRHLKSLILIIPTLTIGLWEYIRHAFLLPYISMDLGNWLAPLLVFLVTMTLLRKLFFMIEKLQEELQKERAAKAALEEREKIAQELHDGIAQSLFLLSVRIDRVEQSQTGVLTDALREAYQSLRKTVHEVNDYVRQAIAGLRYPVNPSAEPWMDSIRQLTEEFMQDTGIAVHLNWSLSEERIKLKEKVELYSTIREAMINAYKHADAANLWIQGSDRGEAGWSCEIRDDGKGFDAGTPSEARGGFGLLMMRERADELGWSLVIRREQGCTMVTIEKEDKR
ncbi:two-component system, NarL family, nitrate/nitrite sensor histidine kinase NarQ [Paenibacillus sp. UNCCL117]|uniref:sensor histidine kinase n=1 Tax=unclassified Paenibacillus TaxID=185978 RepID=UPI00087EF04F|nr:MULTISPECIES: histidine kinase [unclassified Paenibacillus]SDD96983.1 two-component system, NarL family, nitrate/nitrite sensor histidine kinase NarQ [Paenibacillus sp. cl123]SFW56279.1 two-component system, NarL family, nitrate/nitrite sensor histidine kinase NarQ [Paenibacillus sp. UNCCL117]